MLKRNPPWTRDEVILALDLYFKYPPSKINVDHLEVVALSALLNRLPIHPPSSRGVNFRNPNGVHMKMFNLQYLDPATPGGLTAGAAADQEVWNDFAHDIPRLEIVAQAIRDAVKPSAVVAVTQLDSIEDEGVTEGRILLQLHRLRERNAMLVRKKKASILKQAGKLACEVCGFIYKEFYGTLGDGFIECHHTGPLSKSMPGQQTKLDDLALVCANCHRMLHQEGKVRTIQELQQIIRKA